MIRELFLLLGIYRLFLIVLVWYLISDCGHGWMVVLSLISFELFGFHDD